jgi:hypothetical protein
LYKAYIVNTLTQETLIEYDNKDLDFISHFIETCKATEGTECYIFDREQRTYLSNYISHSIVQEGMDKIYKIFFEAKLANLTA